MSEVKLINQTYRQFQESGQNLTNPGRCFRASSLELISGVVATVTGMEKDNSQEDIDELNDILKKRAEKLGADFVLGVNYQVTAHANLYKTILVSGDAYKMPKEGGK